MSASSKFDLSSSSPDRPLYGIGKRGSSSTAASLERSGSFRENMENPILSSLPSMSRTTSTATQGDVTNFLQCLQFNPKLVASDHKFNRRGDFKRLVSIAFGVPPDESPSGSSKGKLSSPSTEELKQLKASLRVSTIKARERVKIFSEGLSAINKFFPSVPSRKRSRSDVLSGDRSNTLLTSDRLVLGAGLGKAASQNHAVGSSFELEQQKSDERATKISFPNKRTRTSMMDPRTDVRANTPARPSGNVDRDNKETLRLSNSGAVQGEDRPLPIGSDGWEKSKMKKKRSVIKADIGPSTVPTKPIDGFREAKQGVQSRLHSADARPRLNDPTYGFRSGATNGVGKADGTSPQSSLVMRSSIPRVDQDNNSPVLHDKKDRTTNSDKEKVNLRAVNRTNVREEFNSASPTSSTKLNGTARAPRSGSRVVPKLSPVVQNATSANDWELSHCTSKNPAAVGPTNRKRTPSNRSSSPPVANWSSISRTARRTNFVPIISSNDETTPALDTVSDVAGSNDNGSGFPRRLHANSPQQVKLKADHFSFSESEESGPTGEIKSNNKVKKGDDIVEKVSTPNLPPRKNKIVSGEELGDGIRRQGRTGRGFASARGPTQMNVEKIRNVGTAKQLRTTKLGFDKNESKPGRPPTRKLSDRRAYTRQKHTTINASADFLVGSDDGHEELLAAANAVINPTPPLSSPFWRQLEPLFGFISDVDVAYVKQQANLESTEATPVPVSLSVDNSSTNPKAFGLAELSPQHLALGKGNPNEISLCQRLLAALITEEGNEEPQGIGYEDNEYDIYGSGFEMDMDVGPGDFDPLSLQSFELDGRSSLNGYRISSTTYNERSDNHIMSKSDMRIKSSFEHKRNGLLPDKSVLPGVACSEYQYANMSIDERVLMEIQSIGLYPEPVPDLTQISDEEISGDISKLEDEYHQQVSKKKSLLDKLLKSTSKIRELQEKEFERNALDKLAEMAYQKYMSCWGPNAPGGKGAGGKMAKQAALAFVKRTLERCQEFEETGKSCFNEPLFKEMFHSQSSQPLDATTTDAPVGTHQSPSLSNHEIYPADALLSVNENTINKEETWSNRVKKRELNLDEVFGGPVGTSSGIGTTLSSSAKGKRSERDREGKGNSRDVPSRNGNPKIGRPASSNVKGERKSKAKPKQKTTHLSASVNGTLGKISEQQPKSTLLSSMPKSNEMATSGSGKEEFGLDVLNNPDALDFTSLQMDDLDGQSEDIGSWLNIDDEGLQDDDFMGLEIPMDDLSDLNMMV